MPTDLSWFEWFQAALAAYLVIAAIRGKGQLFENPHTKCPYETYVRVMRILSAVSGVLLLTGAILRLTNVVSSESVLGWVIWGIGLVSIAAIFVYNIRMTDRKAAAAAQKNAYESARSKDPLRAAFVFDDEEEEKKDGEKQEDREQKGDA
ncbi:MAG TPA: hypothetical protein VN608_02265 [Clostridia bacterium]|nr:hypothetical protein [Clostridia bacterium]